MRNKEVQEKTKSNKDSNKKKKSIRLKKPDIKIPEFLKLTKKQIIWLVTIVIAIVTFVCVSNYDRLGLVLNKNITDKDVIKVDLVSSNNKIYPYGDEVIVANLEGITTYNRYGNSTWELKLKGAIDDEINTNGKYIQIINKDKSLAYVYKNKYETARIKIEGTILSGYINEKGYSVIEYATTGNKTILAVYNSDGSLKYNVKLGSSIIGKYVLSNNSKYLAYVDVNIKGISASSSVVLVRLNNTEESVVTTLYTSPDSLVYDLGFDGNNIVYRLDEKVISQNIDTLESKMSEIKNKSVINIDFYEDKYSYVVFETGKYLLGVKKIGGKDRENVEISEMPRNFIYDNGNVFVFYQKSMEVYNSLRMKIKEYNGSMLITDPIVFGDGRNVAFLVSNKLIMFGI